MHPEFSVQVVIWVLMANITVSIDLQAELSSIRVCLMRQP